MCRPTGCSFAPFVNLKHVLDGLLVIMVMDISPCVRKLNSFNLFSLTSLVAVANDANANANMLKHTITMTEDYINRFVRI
jgi:hypothetical protein